MTTARRLAPFRPPAAVALLLALVLARCGSDDATQLGLFVFADDTRLGPSENDRGWSVSLTAARIVVRDIAFSVGDDVTGDMAGPRVVDWFADDLTLGLALLLPGDYDRAMLALGPGAAALGLAASDPLVGHGAYLAGTARKDGRTVTWSAVLDLVDPPVVPNLPFPLAATPDTTQAIGLRLEPVAAAGGGQLFDGLDFGALADAAGGDTLALGPSDPAAQRLRATLFSVKHLVLSLTELAP